MCRSLFGLLSAVLLLTSCTARQSTSVTPMATEPTIADYTVSGEVLKMLAPAKRKIPVSVYAFTDQTGQHKPNDSLSEYSRAVTQGGLAILSQAMLDAGGGRWFTVIERNGLNNLLQERKIIRAMRQGYLSKDGQKLPNLPPLLYAGMIIEGGIVSYETNTLTGGFGARYLGIGGSTEYRSDIVTVYLRAVQVTNGEIVLSTNTSKTIYSTKLQGGIFKYVGVNELLELETGVSSNEPPQFAVRQAIEMAVYSLIMEGVQKGMWEFANPVAQNKALIHYRKLLNARRKSFESALENYELRSLPASKEAAEAREDSTLSSMMYSWFGREEGGQKQEEEQKAETVTAAPVTAAPVMDAPITRKNLPPPPSPAPASNGRKFYAPYSVPSTPQLQPRQVPPTAAPVGGKAPVSGIIRKSVPSSYPAPGAVHIRKYLSCSPETGCVPTVQ